MTTDEEFDAAVRAEYAKSPALTAFSRLPIPYETASRFGARSASRAQRTVWDRVSAEAAK